MHAGESNSQPCKRECQSRRNHGQNRRLPADTLQADLHSFTAYTLTAVNELHARMAAAEEAELHAANTYAAARDATVALQREFHDVTTNVKTQTKARFGDDSNEVAALGLKKKSERKPPTRQRKTGNNGE